MASYSTKVYVVQKADHDGNLGEVLAVKLNYISAHKIAKSYAPAKVIPFLADKVEELSEPDRVEYREQCNQLQMTIFDLC